MASPTPLRQTRGRGGGSGTRGRPRSRGPRCPVPRRSRIQNPAPRAVRRHLPGDRHRQDRQTHPTIQHRRRFPNPAPTRSATSPRDLTDSNDQSLEASQGDCRRAGRGWRTDGSTTPIGELLVGPCASYPFDIHDCLRTKASRPLHLSLANAGIFGPPSRPIPGPNSMIGGRQGASVGWGKDTVTGDVADGDTVGGGSGGPAGFFGVRKPLRYVDSARREGLTSK